MSDAPGGADPRPPAKRTTGRRRVVVAVALVALGSSAAGAALVAADGGEEPPPAGTTAPGSWSTTPTAGRRAPAGFDEIAIRVERADGVTAEWCALLADDDRSRARGLMGQRDLGGYAGMVFRFPSPTTTSFFMRSTPLPLSIAFFDATGEFVSSADMDPCPDDVDRCPSYAAHRPFLSALEVVQGDLVRLGVGPGAVLSFPGVACPS